MIPVEVVLAVMLTLPQYVGDKKDTAAEREALYLPTATAISKYAKTRSEAAAAIALAYSETALARYVLTGHCDQGPKGARCDEGKARGPFQVWPWCTDAWAAKDGSPESIDAGAKCAINLLRKSKRICKTFPGMFSSYRTYGRCNWPGGVRRWKLMSTVEGRIVLELKKREKKK